MKAFTGVVNIYINIHMMTNLSTDNYQIWASGERKRKHIDTKRQTLMQCCELYMVSQTNNCELYLSSYEHIRRARVFFVKDLLRTSYRICCVTRQESIHAVAGLPRVREKSRKKIFFSRSGNCQGIWKNVREILKRGKCQGNVREFHVRILKSMSCYNFHS